MNTIVMPFYESNKDSVQLVLRSLNNQTYLQQFYKDFEYDIANMASSNAESPYVMFKTENKTLRIYGENLTITNLDDALKTLLTSDQDETEVSAITPSLDIGITAAVLSAGVFSGINPCLIAFTAYMTSASIQNHSTKRLASILRVLLRVATISAGLFSLYFLFGMAFRGIHPVETAALKSVVVAILIALGIAYIVSFRKPNSRLFQTPNFLKKVIISRSKKSILAFDFVLGAAFALIKTPCLVGPYLVVLSWLTVDMALATFYILIFNLGIVLPLFLTAAFLASGIVNISTMDRFRIRERNIVRLLTGVLLLSTSILLFIF